MDPVTERILARRDRDLELVEDGDPYESFLAHRARWIAERDPLWTGVYVPVTRGGVDSRCFGRGDEPGVWTEPDMEVRL